MSPFSSAADIESAAAGQKAYRLSAYMLSFLNSFDTDFRGVIAGCAAPRRRWLHLTWVTLRIMATYARLFDEGHVHSVEVWNSDGAVVDGGYGVTVSRVFVIESQFFRQSNASKIGFGVLAWHSAKWGFALMDNKWLTPGWGRPRLNTPLANTVARRSPSRPLALAST